jgi:16S rRNA (cytosine1402-N4)-methyltransferase
MRGDFLPLVGRPHRQRIFSRAEQRLINPPYERIYEVERKAVVQLVNKKPILPTDEEIKENPRARSAKLRVIEKI